MNLTEQNTYPDEWILGYLSGDLTEEQTVGLNEWLSRDESHRRYLYEMTEIWMTVAADKSKTGDKERAYHHFRQRIEKKKTIRRLPSWIRVAASIVAAILFTGTGLYIGKQSAGSSITSAVQSIETPLGARTRLVLRDGTVAWLNGGSKLSYPSAFNRKREVQLEGEAYFEVTHNTKTPFIVHTPAVEVEVLGTKFSVKDYGEEEETEVILAEGAVNFRNKNTPSSPIRMKPSEQVIYNKRSGEVTTRQVPVSQANIWTTGSHFFNELTFQQIAKILEKSLDVVFIFRNETKRDLIFYGDFRADDSIEDILDIMSRNKKFSYTITGNVIEIF